MQNGQVRVQARIQARIQARLQGDGEIKCKKVNARIGACTGTRTG